MNESISIVLIIALAVVVGLGLITSCDGASEQELTKRQFIHATNVIERRIP